MSEVRPDVDLGALARPADAPRAPAAGVLARPPRRWLRVALPLALLAAFAVVLAWSLGDLGRGRKRVTVVRPRPADALGALGAPGAGRSGGAALFQSAGWVEPDPFPVQVTALVHGVVSEVLALEAASVRAGDVVARLVDADARLARDAAAAAVAEARARSALAAAEAEAARASFEAALAVTEGAAAAAAARAGRRAEAQLRAAAVERGAAEVAIARGELVLQRELAEAGAAAPRQLELAEARLAAAGSALEALRAEAALAEAGAREAAARAERAGRERELRIDEKLRVESTAAAVAAADGALSAAEAVLAAAELALERTAVRAPVDGVVLERLVAPGSTLDASGHGPAVCTLYDPSSLRVRVDVPQSDAPGVDVGSRAEIQTEARPGRPYAGEVIRVVRKADIQKVTLQVHVRVLEPDERLRPEMLCQARFFAPQAPDAPAGEAGVGGGGGARGDAVLVPARLVAGGAAWVVDGVTGRAARRAVELGRRLGALDGEGDWVEVLAGLNLSDKLVDRGREDLEEGDRLEIESASGGTAGGEGR